MATRFGEQVQRQANVRFLQALTKAQELEPIFRKALNMAPWYRRLHWAMKLILGRF
jgi:hypothetical protein